MKVGDKVEAGDQLSQGIINPAEAVKYKGIGEGRRYFAERMTQAFKDSQYNINRRNVEVLSRSLIDHVHVDDQEGVGDSLPGDIVSYNALAYSYKPRPDAKSVKPKQAIGQYLEQPVMHYSIGTRVTPNVAAKMGEYDINSVMVHPQQPGFTPQMLSVVKVPGETDDWMARLGSTYLESRLLEDVHRGSKSKMHSLNPIPSLAKGTEFGQQQGKNFTY